MREIDERVVEMRFKNSNFEKNAKSTIGVLDKLEQKLAFPNAKKNIQGLEKEFSRISFGALEKGIETVTLKFSALQVAGITAIQNITNKAINAGEALVKSLSVDQITSGFSKYEQKTSAVQTIVSATGKTVDEVNTSLKKLNWFTDETSYNFTDMVENIGKFTSAGVDLDDAMSAMIGIANEAAVSGQNAQAASRAMYNFAQAIGVGAVKLMDWKSIENANMATQEFKQTIIDTAVSMGTLEKVADGAYKVVGSKDAMVSVNNFNEELKEGWFTSDVLIKSLKQYSGYAEEIYELQKKMGLDTAAEAMAIYSNEIETLGEKAFKAGQVSKTLTDAIDATKDAVSTQWMNLFEMIVGNLDQAMETWTEFTNYLWDFFASDLVNMNAFLEPIIAKTPYEQLIAELKEAGITEEALGNAMIETGKKHGLAFDTIIESFGSLEAVLTKAGYTNILVEALDDMTNGAEVASTKVVDLTDKMEEYNKVVLDVIRGDYKNGVEARTKALADAGYEFSVIQPLVNRYLKNGTLTMEDYKEVLGELTEEEVKNIKITDNQADSLKELATKLKKPSGRELIIDSFRNALDGLQKVIEVVKEAWFEIFPPKTQEEIYGIIEKFHDFSKKLILGEEGADKLKRSLKGVFAVLDIVKQILGGAFKSALTILGKLFGKTGLDVTELSASLGDNLVAIRDWLNEGNKIGVFFEALTDSILNAKNTVTEWLNSFLEKHPAISKWFNGLIAAFDTFKEKTKDKWSSFIDEIKNGNIEEALKVVASYFREFRDTVITYLTGIDFNAFMNRGEAGLGFSGALTALDKIKSGFLSVVTVIKNAVTTVGGWIVEFVKSLNPMWFIPVIFIGIIVSLNKLSAAVESLLRVLKPLEDIKKTFISTLTKIGKSVQGFMKAAAFSKRMDGVVKLAEAMIILAGACWILSYVPGDELARVSLTILGLLGALVVANNVIAKWGKQGKGLARLSGFAQSLGVCFLLIAASFKILDTIDTNKIGTIMLEITGIFGDIILVLVVLSSLPAELPAITGTLIGLTVVVSLISTNFFMLSLIPTEGLPTKVAAIGAVLLELVGVIALMAIIQKKWKTAAKRTINSVIGMVVALDLLVASLWLIESVNVKDILNHLESFIAVFVMLNVLAGIAGKVSGGSGGWQILALAAGLLILVPAINSFADINGWALAKATAAVAVLLIVEAFVTAFSQYSSPNATKAGAMILMISGAIAALSLVVWGFSALSGTELLKGVGSVTVLLLAIMGLLLTASKIENTDTKTIAFLSIFTVALGAMVAIIAGLDPDAAIKSTGSVALLLLSMGATIKILSTSETLSWGAIGKAFTQLLGLSALSILISSVIADWTTVDADKALPAAGALSMMLIAMSISAAILTKFGQSINPDSMNKAWATMAVMSGVMLALAVIGLIVKDLDPVKMIEQFAAFSAAILMLEVCALGMIGLAKLILVSGGAEALLPALGEAGILVGAIAGIGFLVALIFGIIQQLSTLNGGSGMNGLLKDGVETMTLIGEALGSMIGGFLGGIVGGGLEGMMSHMEQVGQYLTDFSEAIGPFLEKMEKIKPEVGQNISTLTKAILDLTGAEFIQGITDFGELLTTPITPAKLMGADQSTPFDKLGKGLVNFANSVSDVADIFAEMSNRGVMGHLGVAINISNKMVELLNAIPKQSVFGDFFKGEITWENLSNGLVSYGEAVFEYSDWVILITKARQEAIENSIPVAEDLNDLLKKLEPSGGLITSIFGGDHKWGTLTQGLSYFGGALSSYAWKVDEITETGWAAIENSIGPAKKLNELLKELKPSKSVIASVFVENDSSWSTLATGLSDVGDAFYTFGTKMNELESTVGWSSAEKAIPLIESFVSSANTLTEMSGLSYLKDAVDTSASYLGDGIIAFATKFSDDTQDKANVGIHISDQLIELCLLIKDNGVVDKKYLTQFGEDVNGYAQNMAAAAKTFSAITNYDFAEIAKYSLAGFNIEFRKGIGDTKNVVKEFTDTVRDTAQKGVEVHSPSRFFKWLADNCVSGFVNTFSSGVATVKKASDKFTSVVRDTVQNGLGVHSDSTFFSWIAENCNGGFVHTLEAGCEKIKTAVSGWVTNVTDSLNLDSLVSQFSEFGIDLTGVLPDLSSLGLDFGEDLTFNYEKQIADMKTEIQDLTKEFGANSDEVINARLELDKLEDEYKEYTKSRTSNLEYYENKEYSEAQKQFDKLLEDYKAGRKTQMEFDTEYTQLLQKNTAKQAELFQYSAEKIREYVTDSLEKIQSDFETEISDIQSKMDSTTDSWNKSFSEEFKFTTNQDLFDEEISKYDKDIDQLNKQIEKEKKLHGEDSIVVQKLQKDLERVQKTRDEINEQWDEYDEEYKNQIVSVDMTDEWDKQTEKANKTLEAVDSLKDRLSNEMIDWLGTLNPDELYATATYLAGLTDSELQVIENKRLGMIEANKKVAESLYGPEIVAAEEKFVYDYTNMLNELPDTAKAVASDIVTNLSNTFSEETNNTLASFKESGDVIIFAIKQGLGFTNDGSKSEKMEKTGEDMSNGIGNGFASNKDVLVEVFSDTLDNSLYEAVNNVDYDSIASSIRNSLGGALDAITTTASISITPVTKGASNVIPDTKRQLNSGRSVTIAKDTGASFNRRYETENEKSKEATSMAHKALSFVQNIYSPDPISRSEVRRDTKQILQLANSKFK